MSELVNIVLNHRFSILGCARQNMSQKCPSLTKFLPIIVSLDKLVFAVYPPTNANKRGTTEYFTKNGNRVSCV